MSVIFSMFKMLKSVNVKIGHQHLKLVTITFCLQHPSQTSTRRLFVLKNNLIIHNFVVDSDFDKLIFFNKSLLILEPWAVVF